MLFNEGDVLDALGASVTLEYVRDSPMFRQNIAVFEESFMQLNGFCQGVLSALHELNAAFVGLEAAQAKVVTALSRPPKSVSRALFTNALPKLGDLSQSLQTVASVLSCMNKGYEHIRNQIKDQVEPLLEMLAKEDLAKERALHQRMFSNYAVYEQLLGQSLQSRAGLTGPQHDAIIKARTDYELDRYDLVERLNTLDCSKKLLVSRAAQTLCKAFEESNIFAFTSRDAATSSNQNDDIDSAHNLVNVDNNNSSNNNNNNSSSSMSKHMLAHLAHPHAVLSHAHSYFANVDSEINAAVEVMRVNADHWSAIRKKLAGEISGALPPPGSPPGALSPVQPRPYRGMPLYTITITTEILSKRTRDAHYEDVRHARDDGVFKQGYLFVKTGGRFSSRKRKWHRLFSSKLYIVELLTQAHSGTSSCTCTTELVCDMTQSQISIHNSKKPFKFTIVTADRKKLVFQAENEDEQVKWVQALRRCTHNEQMPGRPPATSAFAPNGHNVTPPKGSVNLTTSSLLVHSPYLKKGRGQSPRLNEDTNTSLEPACACALVEQEGQEVTTRSANHEEASTSQPLAATGEAGADPGDPGDTDSVDAEDDLHNECVSADVASVGADANADDRDATAHGHTNGIGHHVSLDSLAGCATDNDIHTFTHISHIDTDTEKEVDRLRSEFYNTVKHQQHAKSLVEFLVCNSTCADCNADRVCWISTNIGITLCEDCAAAHRKLTWAVSKLKSIYLDYFSCWQVQLLLSELGNVNANNIWEPCVAEGWQKPTPKSSIEVKHQWIMAKYQWFAFVDEFRVRSSEQLAEGIFTAAYNSDIPRIHFWLSHKADINCLHCKPELTGRDVSMTPLHAALEKYHINTMWFLLQNGADIYAPDSRGLSVLDIVMRDEEFQHPVVKDMLLQVQRLDY